MLRIRINSAKQFSLDFLSNLERSKDQFLYTSLICNTRNKVLAKNWHKNKENNCQVYRWKNFLHYIPARKTDTDEDITFFFNENMLKISIETSMREKT